MKRILIIAAVISLLATGCASQDINSSTALGTADNAENAEAATALTEIAIEKVTDIPQEPVILTEPPELRIEAVDEMIASVSVLTRGSFSWEYDKDGGGETVATMACGDSAWHCAERGLIHAEIDPSILIKDPRILLTNGGEITSVTRFCGDGVTDIGFGEDGSLHLPKTSEYAAYSVNVKYPQGTCEYFFITNKSNRNYGGSGDSSASVPPAESMTSPAFIPEEKPAEVLTESYIPATIESAPKDYELVFDNEYGFCELPTQIIRTDGHSAGGMKIFTSAQQLEQYISEMRDICQVGNINISDYDDGYFEKNALVMHVIPESSGSVSHRFLGMDPNYQLIIERNVPMIGTCDMAQYHFIAEIPAALAEMPISVVFWDNSENMLSPQEIKNQ